MTTETPTDLLQAGSWKVALKDGNPSGNPGGPQSSVIYYAWKVCRQVDIYTFKDGKLKINQGMDVCETPETDVACQYDPLSQKLDIGEMALKVAELIEKNLKYYVETPAPAGFSYLVYILEKN